MHFYFPAVWVCQASWMQKAEEGDDSVFNGFTRSTSAFLSLLVGGGVSVALSPPSLSNPLHLPSLSPNHSDPAHLEPMCFSILSSTVVISNQPLGLSLSPHQQPGILTHPIPVRCTSLLAHTGKAFFFLSLLIRWK